MLGAHGEMVPDVYVCHAVVRWGAPETGGHFPSLEVPRYFVNYLQKCLAAVLTAGG